MRVGKCTKSSKQGCYLLISPNLETVWKKRRSKTKTQEKKMLNEVRRKQTEFTEAQQIRTQKNMNSNKTQKTSKQGRAS